MASRYRHACRPVHAKSHGVLLGTWEVLPGWPIPFPMPMHSPPEPKRFPRQIKLELLIKEFFRNQVKVWDMKAQLAVAPAAAAGAKNGEDDFPIEQADQKWPEHKSPWQVIGRVTVDPRDSYSDARQLFVDEQLSFSPCTLWKNTALWEA